MARRKDSWTGVPYSMNSHSGKIVLNVRLDRDPDRVIAVRMTPAEARERAAQLLRFADYAEER